MSPVARAYLRGSFVYLVGWFLSPSDGMAEGPQTVTVSGSANSGEGYTAIRTTVPREELLKFGDHSLGDALARIPGLSVVGSGPNAEIRLRGLGKGLTRVLLNGVPVPDGFSVNSLSPETIERVEIIPSTSADSSNQGIAGTVNIVLRTSTKKGQRLVAVKGSTFEGLGSASISLQLADGHGSASYSIASSVNRERTFRKPLLDQQATDGDGRLLFSRQARMREDGRIDGISVAPRLTLKLSETGAFITEGFLQYQRYDFSGSAQRTTLAGQPPSFDADALSNVTTLQLLRGSISWKDSAFANGSADLKVTASANRRVGDAGLRGFDATAMELLDRSVDSVVQDNSLIAAGTYGLPIASDHSISVGLDGQYGRRTESRSQRETSTTGYPTVNLDEGYSADVARLALFAQDDWSAGRGLSLYAGIRWEGLHTDTSSRDGLSVRKMHSVVSPSLQLLYKIPGTKADRVKVALGRSYRPPTAQELIPRLWLATDNSATTPNFRGNPELSPELAWAFDVNHQSSIASGSSASVGAYARRVKDVIVRTIFQDASGAWVAMPVNGGVAHVGGLDAELKGRRADFAKGSPDIGAQVSIFRNWSWLRSVPRPVNRLAAQPSFGLNISFDWKVATVPLTWGMNGTYERRDFVRGSVVESQRLPGKRLLDAFLVWQPSSSTKVRMTATNLLRRENVTETFFTSPSLVQSQRMVTPTYTVFGVGVDLSLN